MPSNSYQILHVQFCHWICTKPLLEEFGFVAIKCADPLVSLCNIYTVPSSLAVN